MYAAFLYDAVYQYAIALNKTLASNETPDGRNIISKLLNKEYNSKYRCYIRKLNFQTLVTSIYGRKWWTYHCLKVPCGEFCYRHVGAVKYEFTFGRTNKDDI